MARQSSDEVSASVLDSPSAVLSGPARASNGFIGENGIWGFLNNTIKGSAINGASNDVRITEADARAEVMTQLPKYLLIGGVVLSAVFLVSRFGKK